MQNTTESMALHLKLRDLMRVLGMTENVASHAQRAREATMGRLRFSSPGITSGLARSYHSPAHFPFLGFVVTGRVLVFVRKEGGIFRQQGFPR